MAIPSAAGDYIVRATDAAAAARAVRAAGGTVTRRLSLIGGVAAHTTEFNLESGDTIDNWPTVLFQAGHIAELERRLRVQDNVIKYITRAEHKGNTHEDLCKARWYLNREIAKHTSATT